MAKSKKKNVQITLSISTIKELNDQGLILIPQCYLEILNKMFTKAVPYLKKKNWEKIVDIFLIHLGEFNLLLGKFNLEARLTALVSQKEKFKISCDLIRKRYRIKRRMGK